MGPADLLLCVSNALENLNIPYFVTGGFAAIAYGEPRFTNDVDIVADIKLNQVKLLHRFFSDEEYYFDEEMAKDAIHTGGQFNIIHPSSGLKVDIIIRGRSDFDNSRFSRTKRFPVNKQKEANFASPEDVIIKKMEYYQMGASDKHLRDIVSIMKVSGDEINQEYIAIWVKRFGLDEIWQKILGMLKTSK